MVFLACGLSHKTAPLAVREKIASTALDQVLLDKLIHLAPIREAAILSTCNRTEIYCETEEPLSLISWLAKEHDLALKDIAPYFYLHEDTEAVRHTLRVASGLDSMMLGEPQILGQMKKAYQNALDAGTIKVNLRSVFQYIFQASKRIRNLSGIGKNPISIAYAALQLIKQIFADYQNLNVFLIGSGEMASLIAKHLHKEGVRQFMVASRTHEQAQKLAHIFNAKALTIGDIPQYLPKADIVISATACPMPFITESLVTHTLSLKNDKPIFFLDLAVPRDVEEGVAELERVYLYNIDDLKLLADEGLEQRMIAAEQAELLINIELENYIRWHRVQQAKKLICHYREHMEELADMEVERALNKISQGHVQKNVLSEFKQRLLNKLIHYPTVGLRDVAADDRQDLLDLMSYLYTLKPIQNE